MRVTREGVTIPAEALRPFGIEPETEVELEESDRGPVIVPAPAPTAPPRPGRLSLEDALGMLYELGEPDDPVIEELERIIRLGATMDLMPADELMALTRGSD